MADVDSHATQRGLAPEIPAELRDAGFDDVTEIGHGGFGVVYRCVQTVLDRTVAVKVLSSDLDPDNVDRFMREQRAMGRLSGHPHIVQILEVGTTASGRPFIVMPYHAKDSLEAVIRKHGPLDWSEALSICVKLAGALDAAHQVGTLHRDVKPANILLTDYGEPQLTDFGIARIAGGLRDRHRGDHRFARFHRARSARGRDADGAVRRVLPWRNAVLRADRTCGVRAPQRRTGRRPVSANHVAAGTGSARARTARRCGRDHRTGHVARSLRSSSERGAVRRTSFGDLQRSSGVAVDEMARPVELGVERRESTGVCAGTSARNHADADTADACDEVPSPGRSTDRCWPATG